MEFLFFGGFFLEGSRQKWFSFSGFFPSPFRQPSPSMASTFRQSILRGGQCQFRCYCVNVSMALPPPSLFSPKPQALESGFCCCCLQTELVVHTFHSNFHLAILSGCVMLHFFRASSMSLSFIAVFFVFAK